MAVPTMAPKLSASLRSARKIQNAFDTSLAVTTCRHFRSSSARKKEVQDVYILSAARTPVAKFNASFLSTPAPVLGAVAIKSAIQKSNIPISKISDVYFGNAIQAGVGQAPARQAAMFAGLPSHVEAVTVNKLCSSGLKAVALAAQNIQLGLAEAQIAGGMENMSRVPYYIPRAGQNPAFGDMKLEDGLMRDGLIDTDHGFHVGVCGEKSGRDYNISREEQDAYAIRSFERAQAAWASGKFDEEIAPVTIKMKSKETVISVDEGYDSLNKSKVPTLKPSFVRNGTGTITPANSSTLNDGASALVLGSKSIAREFGLKNRILAKIISTADASLDPVDFPVAPAKAIPLALQRAGLKKQDIAIWEINEAFAVVVIANQKILELENAQVNLLGGAISLGHALGSSGSRILTTLLHQLKVGEFGMAAICNGGGGATAMVVQRVDAV